MVEEYQQAVSAANHGGVRDHLALYPHFGLTCSPQVLIFSPFDSIHLKTRGITFDMLLFYYFFCKCQTVFCIA